MSFQLSVLNREVLSEHKMGNSLSRKKRGRPKSVPSALETSDIVDVDDEDHGDEDDIEEGTCFPWST